MDTTTASSACLQPVHPVPTASTPTSSSSVSARPGGTAALALATYGVRVHAVTMFPWVANSPRAHITNQRAVEVLRDLGHRGRGPQVRHPVGPDGRHPVHHQPGR